MGIIEDIIARTLRRMERDLSEIKNIRRIDFVDLFPTSESHRKMLDEQIADVEYYEGRQPLLRFMVGA